MAEAPQPDATGFGADVMAELAAHAIAAGFRAVKNHALHESDLERILKARRAGSSYPACDLEARGAFA